MIVCLYEVVVLVFAFQQFSAAQVISSTHFSDFLDDGPKSEITCYGNAYDEDIAYLLTAHLLSDSGTDEPAPPTVEPMAQRCGHSFVRTKCGYRYRPPVLLFDGIYSKHGDDDDGQPIWNEAETWNGQLWAQICNIKCRCTREYPEDQTLGPSPEFETDHIYYFEWNFDTSQSVRLNLRRHQTSLNLYGSNAENLDLNREDIEDNPEAIVFMPEVAVNSFVGSPSNQPSCENGPRRHWSTAGVYTHGMSHVLYMFIHQTLLIDQHFQSPTEVCLHELYGGRKGLNFGGICLHPNGLPELTFPKNFRAPEFTNDYYGTLAGLVGEQVIQLFCRSQCGCSGELDLETKKKDAKQKLMDSEKSLDSIPNNYMFQEVPKQLPDPEDQQPKSKKGMFSTDASKTHHRNTCSALTCKGNADCGNGCVCQVAPQFVDPSDFKIPRLAFRCAAIVSSQLLRSGLGAARYPGGKKMKRGASIERNILEKEFKMLDKSLCACNATWVSTSCCWSDNGLVWEAL